MLGSTRAIVVAAMLGLPLPAVAESFNIRDSFDIPIYPIDANAFEVVEADGAGGTQIWCAAGLFARDHLVQGTGTLYIQKARGDSQSLPGRKSVTFTTQAVEGAFSTLTQGVRRAGLTFSVSHTYALCRDTPRLRISVAGNGF